MDVRQKVLHALNLALLFVFFPGAALISFSVLSSRFLNLLVLTQTFPAFLKAMMLKSSEYRPT